MDASGTIRRYIANEFLHETNPNALGEEEPLIGSGIIDSMGLIQLAGFLEKEFGIKITEEELDLDNFRTLNALAAFIGRKTKGAGN